MDRFGERVPGERLLLVLLLPMASRRRAPKNCWPGDWAGLNRDTWM